MLRFRGCGRHHSGCACCCACCCPSTRQRRLFAQFCCPLQYKLPWVFLAPPARARGFNSRSSFNFPKRLHHFISRSFPIIIRVIVTGNPPGRLRIRQRYLGPVVCTCARQTLTRIDMHMKTASDFEIDTARCHHAAAGEGRQLSCTRHDASACATARGH